MDENETVAWKRFRQDVSQLVGRVDILDVDLANFLLEADEVIPYVDVFRLLSLVRVTRQLNGTHVVALDGDRFALPLLEFRKDASDPDCFFRRLAGRDVLRFGGGCCYAALAAATPCYWSSVE